MATRIGFAKKLFEEGKSVDDVVAAVEAGDSDQGITPQPSPFSVMTASKFFPKEVIKDYQARMRDKKKAANK